MLTHNPYGASRQTFEAGAIRAVCSGIAVKRMMGFEPTTFCMASRRSSQLSYIRERRKYSRDLTRPNRALR